MSSCLFFFHLGGRDLISSHEARAAQNGQRMLDTGDWGLPVSFDDKTDLQKPPGYYWLTAAAGWVNGGRVDAWTARLPAALAGLATVLLVYGFLAQCGTTLRVVFCDALRRAISRNSTIASPRRGESCHIAGSRPTAAWIAAIVLATAIHFTAIARTARIDIPLTCAVAVSLMAFYRGCASVASRRRLAWHVLSAIAAAAGVMLKGPVALALIGPAAVVFLLVERLPFFAPSPRRGEGGERRSREPGEGEADLRRERSDPSPPAPLPSGERGARRPLARLGECYGPVRLPLSSFLFGPIIVVALACPWFLWANQATGGELAREFLWHHNVERFAGTSATLATHPWWYYLPRFAADFLPWSPALLFLIVWAMRTGAWRHDRLFRFGLVWLATMFVVLSAAGFKRADYLLPLYPGAAIAFGCAAEAWRKSRVEQRSVRRADRAFTMTVAAAAIGWLVMIFAVEPAEQAPEEKRDFAAMIRDEAPPPNEIILFRMESHLLALHLGRPLVTLVEWHDLNDRLAEPGPHYVVMPPEYVYATDQIVKSRKLEAVARLEDFTPAPPGRPLVFLRTVK